MADVRCENPGCPRLIDPVRVARGAKACNAACRAAAFRARHGIRRVSDARGPVVAGEGRSHASHSGPSGLQVSYRKALTEIHESMLVAADQEGYPDPEAAVESMFGVVEGALYRALSEKQRARLEAQS